MFLGLDFGTSGARACAIDHDQTIVWERQVSYPDPAVQTPSDWRAALHTLLNAIPKDLVGRLRGLAIDGTSGTVLLCDAKLEAISPALLYHDSRAQQQAVQLKNIANNGNTVYTATSGLAKFLWLTQQSNVKHAAYFLHQADWLTALLSGKPGISDYHNALKTGYDVEQLRWPDWVMAAAYASAAAGTGARRNHRIHSTRHRRTFRYSSAMRHPCRNHGQHRRFHCSKYRRGWHRRDVAWHHAGTQTTFTHPD
jgi:sugar (pentulose or hexulose) kinase